MFQGVSQVRQYLHASSSFEAPPVMTTTTKRKLSPEHAEALQAGLKASGRGGPKGVEIGRARALKALRWIYIWGWSAPSLIENLEPTNRSGLAARLVRQGLLKQHRTPAGGGVRDVPIFMLTLTELGENEVVRHLDDLDDLIPYAPRVNWNQMRHDFLVQRLTLQAMHDDSMLVRSVTSDSVVRARGTSGKIHDAVWTDEYQVRTLVEVELTPKKNRELDAFVHGCVNSLIADPDARLRIYSDSFALLKHYSQRLEPWAKFHSWRRDNSRHWVMHQEFEVPESMKDRITFHKIT